MIAINCTHCQQRLEMDEAFAGGVCRCQYCGTIQTVPSHLKKSTAATAAPAKAVHPAGGSGTGLDELAEVVASSGLARSGLTKKGRGAPRNVAASATPAASRAAAAAAHTSGAVDYAAPDPRRRSAMVPLFIGLSAVTLLVAGAVAFFVVSGTTALPGGGGGTGNGSGGAGALDPAREDDTLTIPGPAFADVDLKANASVVYLVDRSQANADVLDMLKAAIYHSALSLGPERKFQILFWSHKTEGIVAYPENGLAPATKAQVDAAGQAFENVIGYDNTDLKPTLERAVAVNPDAIVIATAKGLYLEEDTLAVFDAALQGTVVKVYAFSVGETESPVLKQVAEKTGGRYRELSQTQLRKLKFHIPGS
jgi:hypothetical protein